MEKIVNIVTVLDFTLNFSNSLTDLGGRATTFRAIM